MTLIESDKIVEEFMDIHTSKWIERLESPQPHWEYQSRRIRWRYFMRVENFLESPKLRELEIATVTSMLVLTSHLPWNSPQLTHSTSTMTIRANHQRDRWCDICKMRWGMLRSGVWHPYAQKPARWIVKSETAERLDFERAYCQECSNELQQWPDGTTWSFREQLNYALGKQEIDGLELG